MPTNPADRLAAPDLATELDWWADRVSARPAYTPWELGLIQLLRKAAAELRTLQQQLDDWESREAAICPEDVGFEEYIRTLQKRLAALSAEREPEKPATLPSKD